MRDIPKDWWWKGDPAYMAARRNSLYKDKPMNKKGFYTYIDPNTGKKIKLDNKLFEKSDRHSEYHKNPPSIKKDIDFTKSHGLIFTIAMIFTCLIPFIGPLVVGLAGLLNWAEKRYHARDWVEKSKWNEFAQKTFCVTMVLTSFITIAQFLSIIGILP